MSLVALWCGVVGAWLLVAGSIYQAFLELHKEQVAADQMARATTTVPSPPAVSSWWWLLPPVKLYRDGQRRNQHRLTFLASLTSDERETIVAFLSLSRGWLLVATGGLLIAIQQTYDLVERLDLSLVVFWLAIVTLFAVSILITAVHRATIQRSRALIQR